MSSKLSLQVAPVDMMEPITTPLPLNKARRWNSPYDTTGMHPVVSVFVTQPAYSRICVHSVSDLDNEVGGILVGE